MGKYPIRSLYQMDQQAHDALKRAAAAKGMKVSALVRQWMMERLQQEGFMEAR